MLRNPEVVAPKLSRHTQLRSMRSMANTMARAARHGWSRPLATTHARSSAGPAHAAAAPRVSQRHARSLATAASSTTEAPADGAPKVVIIGGGFGGLYTAVRLASLFWPKGKTPQITLVDRAERFVFKPLLYELLNGAADEAEVAPPLQQLLAPYPVRFVQAQVMGAEPESLLKDGGSASGGRVLLDNGSTLDYDWLVVALGSEPDARGVPGVKENAVPFNSLEDAIKVRDALASIEARCAEPASVEEGGSDASAAQPTVMVVGAGYAGVELAAVVAERLLSKPLSQRPRVQLVTPGDSVLSSSPVGQRAAAQDVLSRLGVEVVTGTRVRSVTKSAAPGALPTAVVVDLESTSATDYSSTSSSQGGTGAEAQDDGSGPASSPSSSGSYRATADVIMWTAGSAPATRAVPRSGFPFPTDTRGSVQTDATLRVRGHARVFAVGDVAVSSQGYTQDASMASTSGLPATAQVAFQQADYVAWNVWAAMNDRALLPFRYQHLGSMLALGATNAAVALPVPVPLPLQTTVQSSPLGPLLSSLGVKLVGGDESGVVLEGPVAALIRRAAYLYRQPTGEQRLSVAASWLQKVAGEAAAAAATAFPQQGRST